MGEVNFVPGTVKAVDAASAKVETAIGDLVLAHRSFTAAAPTEGQRVTLCIRPEHFRRGDAATEAATALGQATVTAGAFFGTHYRCHLKPLTAPELAIVAHMPQSAGVVEGQSVALAVTASDVVALPAHGGGN
nr:TOBE domain-containing protein [Rhizobium sp. AC44/96]